jgi:hypothetical protein
VLYFNFPKHGSETVPLILRKGRIVKQAWRLSDHIQPGKNKKGWHRILLSRQVLPYRGRCHCPDRRTKALKATTAGP